MLSNQVKKGQSSALDLITSPHQIREELPEGRGTEDAVLAEAECNMCTYKYVIQCT